MSSRSRVAVFAVLLLGCLAAATAVVIAGVRAGEATTGAADGVRDLLADAEADGRPVVVYNRAGGEGPGRLALAPLDPAPGRSSDAPLRCDRVYFAAGRGICVTRGSGFAAGYKAMVFGADLEVRREVEVAGLPSRARVSPDGRYGSVTMFVTGHSYAAAGSFSTETTLIDLERGESLGNLEEFTVLRGGRPVTAVDRNYWGVTFARDGDRFYATLATGGRTHLIEGSISGRTARVVHENVECPSLSPDGTRIAYKRRTDSDERPWRLTVLDLATMRETPLAETRSVDDQAEWLDDDTVLYGVDGAVWSVPADGSGEPSRFLADAASPAVVRR
jgi:dipeptidyl aminopeptidase/acylaminoacyl peptidase